MISIFFLLDSKIDALAISETKIDSSVNNNEIHLPRFEVVRKDRSVNGRSGGGVCIYSRTSCKRAPIMSRICGRLREEVTYQRSDHRESKFWVICIW